MNSSRFMYGYPGKIAGALLTTIFLITLVVVQLTKTNVFGINHSLLLAICKFVLIAGLFLTGFSRERREDEIVERIRMDSLQFSFYLSQCMLLGVGLATTIRGGGLIEANLLFLIASMSAASYVATFNVCLHTSIRKDTNNLRLGYILGGVIAVMFVIALILIENI